MHLLPVRIKLDVNKLGNIKVTETGLRLWQEYVKVPSYFACSFDAQNDGFLCKSDDPLNIPVRPISNRSDEGYLNKISPSVDPVLLEHQLSIKKKLDIENSKEIAQMRFYFSVCKGLPQHGVRGGKSFWSKACFKDAKFTQKLRQHGTHDRMS